MGPRTLLFNSVTWTPDAHSMEWIGPLLIAGLVFLCVFQLFWAHTISAIAKKTDQSDLFQVLAWIPLLQLAPTLAAGGSGVGSFLLGSIALLIGNAALFAAGAFLGSTLGGLLGALGLALTGLLCLVYVGRIAYRTASARDLPGWVGLLIFVPVVNFFIYPYIAFHDGWVWPNKVGVVIGSILILGSTAPTFQAVQDLDEMGGLSPDFLLTLTSGDAGGADAETPLGAVLLAQWANVEGEPGSGSPEPADLANADQKALRVLYLMKSRFDEIDSLENAPSGHGLANKGQILALIQAIRSDLEGHRSDLDSETFMELGRHLLEVEARLSSEQTNNAMVRRSTADFDTRGAAVGPAALDSIFDDRVASYDTRTAPPLHPFPVHANETCPNGTERQERSDAKSEQEWCQQLASSGGLRHGWYARYLSNGRPESMGQYDNGLKVGVWTRFYPTGEIRAQAEFDSGMQHGWVLSFDKYGQRTRSARYASGIRVDDGKSNTL